jgi:hypothetical protein
VKTRAVFQGTGERTELSSYKTPSIDGANLETVSPYQVRPLSSSVWCSAPQFRRICPEAVELSPATTASDTRANIVRVTSRIGNAIEVVGVPGSTIGRLTMDKIASSTITNQRVTSRISDAIDISFSVGYGAKYQEKSEGNNIASEVQNLQLQHKMQKIQ